MTPPDPWTTFQQAQDAVSGADANAIMNVATGWATLAGNLQVASQQLASYQADLLASGWQSPATADFNSYISTLQTKAQGLMGAAHAVGQSLSNASEAARTASGTMPSQPITEAGFRAMPPMLQQLAAGQATDAMTTLDNAYQNSKATIQNVHSTLPPTPNRIDGRTPFSLSGPSSGPSSTGGSSSSDWSSLRTPSASGRAPYRPGVPDITGVPLASGASSGVSGGSVSSTGGRVRSAAGFAAPPTLGAAGFAPGGVTVPAGLGAAGGGPGVSGGGTSGGSAGPAVDGGSSGGGSPGWQFVPGVGWVPPGQTVAGTAAGSGRTASGQPTDALPEPDPGIIGGIPQRMSSGGGSGFGGRRTAPGDNVLPDQGDGIFGGEPVPNPAAGYRAGTGSVRAGDPVPGRAGSGYGGAAYEDIGYSGSGYGASGYGSSTGGGSAAGAAGSRLNASQAEQEASAYRRSMSGASASAAGEGEGMPMAPMGGLGAGGERENQRGKRTRYSREDPKTWASNKPVVPPVIE